MVLSLWMSSGRIDAGDDQFADFEIDADFLLALDHEVAVRQERLRHDGGDVGLQRFSERLTEPLPSLEAAESSFSSGPAQAAVRQDLVRAA